MNLLKKLFLKKQSEFLTISELRERIENKQEIPLSIYSANKGRRFIVKPRTIFDKRQDNEISI